MPQTLSQFGQTIKAKHPEYGDMSDEDVATKVLAKYPEYRDMVTTGPPSTNGATIGAAPSTENSATNFYEQVKQDLSQGGSRTAVGRILGQLQGRGAQGYTGLNAGVSEGAGNFMGSPALGIANALQGAARIPEHPVAGPLQMLSGAAQAGTIPGLVVGGPSAATAIEAVPSAKYAGRVLNDLAERVGDAPVALNESLSPLQRLAELKQRGGAGNVPAGVQQLIDRSQAPVPLIYPEARDFVSNISDLSTADKLAANAKVASQVGKLTRGLHGDIASALGDLGPDYLTAISEYSQAKRLQENALRYGKNAAKVGATGAAAYLGGKGVLSTYRRLTQ